MRQSKHSSLVTPNFSCLVDTSFYSMRKALMV